MIKKAIMYVKFNRAEFRTKNFSASLYVPETMEEKDGKLNEKELVIKKIKLSECNELIKSRRLIIAAHGALVEEVNNPDFQERVKSFLKPKLITKFFPGKDIKVKFVCEEGYFLGLGDLGSAMSAPLDMFIDSTNAKGFVTNHYLSGDYVCEQEGTNRYDLLFEKFLNAEINKKVNKGIERRNIGGFKIGGTTRFLLNVFDDLIGKPLNHYETELISPSSGSGGCQSVVGDIFNILHIESGDMQLNDLFGFLKYNHLLSNEVVVYCCRGYEKTAETKTVGHDTLINRQFNSTGFTKSFMAKVDFDMSCRINVIKSLREEEFKKIKPNDPELQMKRELYSFEGKKIGRINYNSVLDNLNIINSKEEKIEPRDSHQFSYHYQVYYDAMLNQILYGYLTGNKGNDSCLSQVRRLCQVVFSRYEIDPESILFIRLYMAEVVMNDYMMGRGFLKRLMLKNNEVKRSFNTQVPNICLQLKGHYHEIKKDFNECMDIFVLMRNSSGSILQKWSYIYSTLCLYEERKTPSIACFSDFLSFLQVSTEEENMSKDHNNWKNCQLDLYSKSLPLFLNFDIGSDEEIEFIDSGNMKY